MVVRHNALFLVWARLKLGWTFDDLAIKLGSENRQQAQQLFSYSSEKLKEFFGVTSDAELASKVEGALFTSTALVPPTVGKEHQHVWGCRGSVTLTSDWSGIPEKLVAWQCTECQAWDFTLGFSSPTVE